MWGKLVPIIFINMTSLVCFLPQRHQFLPNHEVSILTVYGGRGAFLYVVMYNIAIFHVVMVYVDVFLCSASKIRIYRQIIPDIPTLHLSHATCPV